METQISTLLRSTFLGGDNEEIKNAQNALYESMAHPIFFPSLFNIILDQSSMPEIKISAISFLRTSISMFWDQENSPFNPQVRQYLFHFIPQLLKVSPFQMIQTRSHLVNEVVNRIYLTNEWPEIFSEITSGFSDQSQNQDNNIRSSLILSNSLISVFLKINNKFSVNPPENLNQVNQILIQFTFENLVPNILNIFQTKKSNIQLISLCYKIVTRICNFNLNLFGELFRSHEILGNLAQEMVQFSFNISQIPPNDPLFELLLNKIMKFLITCYSNPFLLVYVNMEFLVNFLPIIQEILKSSFSNKVKCNTFQFFSLFFSSDSFWESYGELNSANALISTIFPLFSLSASDVELLSEEAATFISENQKIIKDYNDLKSTSSFVLNSMAKKHPSLLNIIIPNITNSYEMYMSNQMDHFALFSTFHMCSNVISIAAKKSNDSVLSLFHTIFPLFQVSENSSPIATAAAFFLLSSCQTLLYSKDLIRIVFVHIDNPFNLTRLLAIKCISSILRQVLDDPQMKEELFAEFGPKLEQSFQILLTVSGETFNADFTESFIHFFSMFGERLLPFSQTLANSFLGMINDIINSYREEDSEQFSSLVMTINSFSSLLKIIVKSNEISAELCPFIFHSLIQLLPSVPNSAIDFFFTLFQQIVLDSPFFIPSFWEITSLFNPAYSKYFNQLFELIQFKEVEMQNDSSAIRFMSNFINNSLGQINDLESFSVYCPAFTGFLLRLSPIVLELNGGSIFMSIIQKMVPLIQFLLEAESAGESEFENFNILRLLNAMIIVNAGAFANACGDALPPVLIYWQHNLIYPLSIPAVLNIFQLQLLNNDQKSDILASLLDLAIINLRAVGAAPDESDDDDSFDDVDGVENAAENCPWFQENTIKGMLNQIFGQIHDESLLVKCNPEDIIILHGMLSNEKPN